VPKFSKVRRCHLCVAGRRRLTAEKYPTAAAAAAAAAVQSPVNQSIMLLLCCLFDIPTHTHTSWIFLDGRKILLTLCPMEIWPD